MPGASPYPTDNPLDGAGRPVGGEIDAGHAAMPAEITQDAARAMLAALKNLRPRFHAACIAAGSDAWAADASCHQADAAIAAAEGR